jgi:hypothetical protein
MINAALTYESFVRLLNVVSLLIGMLVLLSFHSTLILLLVRGLGVHRGGSGDG